MNKDPYEVLQINRGAEQEVIEAAYKGLARKYHPDKNRSPKALDRMKEINLAYEILSDAEKRRNFDAHSEEFRRKDAEQKNQQPSQPESPLRTRTSVEAKKPWYYKINRFFRTMGSNLGVVGELLGFLWKQKMYVLIPMVVVLVVFGLLIIFASASGIGPFIYTLF